MEVFYGGCKAFEGHVWVCRPVVEKDALFGFPALLWSMRQPVVRATVCTVSPTLTPSPIIMEQPLGACELLYLPCDWCREHSQILL